MADDESPAYKLFIESLVSCKKIGSDFNVSFGKDTIVKPLYSFQLQVMVVKLAGLQNEIMIVSDKTGKAKATRSNKVPGDFSWIKPGVVCSIVGTLLEAGKLPHIDVLKIAPVENSILKEMWSYEVTELCNLLTKRVIPRLKPCTDIDLS